MWDSKPSRPAAHSAAPLPRGLRLRRPSLDSFRDLEDWHRLACEQGRATSPLKMLLANKSPLLQRRARAACRVLTPRLWCTVDLKHLRAVSPALHRSFAAENGMLSVATSAKTGERVDAAFLKIACVLCKIPEAEVAGRQLAPGVPDFSGHRTVLTLHRSADQAPKRSACTVQ